MFDSPFDFLSLVIAIVAFAFARKAFNQVAMLRARLDAMEAMSLQARPGSPPLTPLREEQILAPGVAAQQPAAVADAKPEAPATEEQTAASTASTGGSAAPRLFRNQSPASRNASAPAGWSGSVA
jgi:hypothetical protein